MGMRRETLHRKVCAGLQIWLAGESKLLFAAVAYKADEIAEGLGRKSELFPSLFDYERLLPGDWCARWIGDDNGGMMYAMRRDNPEAISTWSPVAGAFDAAVDMGPSILPRLPVPA